jgi:hypothetical protein
LALLPVVLLFKLLPDLAVLDRVDPPVVGGEILLALAAVDDVLDTVIHIDLVIAGSALDGVGAASAYEQVVDAGAAVHLIVAVQGPVGGAVGVKNVAAIQLVARGLVQDIRLMPTSCIILYSITSGRRGRCA